MSSVISVGVYCGWWWLVLAGVLAGWTTPDQVQVIRLCLQAPINSIQPLGKCKSGSRYESNRFWQSGSGAGGVEISTLLYSPVLTLHTGAGLGSHLFVKSGVTNPPTH